MKLRPLPLLGGASGCILALLGSGCSSPSPSETTSAASREAAEQARREERQKIMQDYWYEHTAVAADPSSIPARGETQPLLAYPAGLYSGLRFAARRAPDPSLAEPDR